MHACGWGKRTFHSSSKSHEPLTGSFFHTFIFWSAETVATAGER